MGDLVCLGAIVGAFGVRGDVRLKSFCAVPEDIHLYSPLSTEDGTHSFSIKVIGQVKNGLTVRLGGVSSKEQADALRGTRLYAPRDRLPNLPDDEFYHADLIGVAVVDTGGSPLGKVSAVHNHGAGDILEIQGKSFPGSALIPFTLEFVPTVDLTAGRIIVDPPDGAIPDG